MRLCVLRQIIQFIANLQRQDGDGQTSWR